MIFPDKVYGRVRDYEELEPLAKEFLAGKSVSLVVSGSAGIGKTSFITGFLSEFSENDVWLLKGKSLQFKEKFGYGSVAALCKELVKILASESEAFRRTLKENFQNELQENISLLNGLCPEMQNVFGGDLSENSVLGSEETKNRFEYTVATFFRCLADSKPLIIWLDDIQWSDISSLKVLSELVIKNRLAGIMLIFSFRDQEVSPRHPVWALADSLQKEVTSKNITPGPLNNDDMDALLQDVFRNSSLIKKEHTDTLKRYTDGIPLLIKEFISLLPEKKVVTFRSDLGAWDWDLVQTKNMNLNPRLADFLLARLPDLSDKEKDIYKAAACTGLSFDTRMLLYVSQARASDAEAALKKLLKADLIMPARPGLNLACEGALHEAGRMRFYFRHDKIRQIFYEQLSPVVKEMMHFRAGEYLAEASGDSPSLSVSAEIDRHFSASVSYFRTTEQKSKLFARKMELVRKTRFSAGWVDSLHLMESAEKLLGKNSWNSDYPTTRNFYSLYCELLFLCGKNDKAEGLFKTLLEKSRSGEEKAGILCFRAEQYAYTGSYDESINQLFLSLQELGISMDKKPGMLKVMGEIAGIRLKLRRFRRQDPLEQPEMTDSRHLLAMKVLMELIASAYLAGRDNLFLIAALNQLKLSLRYGNCSISSHSYAIFSYVMSGFFKDYESSFFYARVSDRLNERYRDPRVLARSIFISTFSSYCWSRPWAEVLSRFEKAISKGLQSGDYMYVAHSCANIIAFDLKSPLEKLLERDERCLKIIADIQNTEAFLHGQIFYRLHLALQGNTRGSDTLETEERPDLLEKITEKEYKIGQGIYHFCAIQLCYSRPEK